MSETKDKQEAAKDRLAIALPHILAAFQEAKQNGIPTLVVAARAKEGGGKMYLTLNDPEDFLRDVAQAAGLPFELTEEQEVQYRASKFLAKF